MKKIVWSLFLAILLLTLPQAVSTSPGSGDVYVFLGWWGLDDLGDTGWHNPGTGRVPYEDGGSGDGQFVEPRDIAVDSDGNVYVADTYNDRIQKFDSDGNFIMKWGEFGDGDGQFDEPWGVGVSSDGYVYVADTRNDRIQKFDLDGNFIKKWGSEGIGEGQFDWPRGVAVDSDGYVYVADTYNDRIQKFDSEGKFELMWGGFGVYEDGKFFFTGDVAVDSKGDVYVTDVFINNRIQKFDSDGNFIRKWGSGGKGDGQFNALWGICVDSDDMVYVADTSNHRIQKFDSDGNFLGWWGLDDLGDTKWHPKETGRIPDIYGGNGDGQFVKPDGVAVDSEGNIYVADTLNDRIQKIGLLPPLGVTYPNGGEVLSAKTTSDITWDPGLDNNNVKIEFSANKGMNWEEIEASTENDGLYEDWTVPCNLSVECLIRITGLDDLIPDVSDEVFSIESNTPPVITLIGPPKIYLECGIEDYDELGASAEDGCGKDVPVVIKGDTVDTMTCDTYTITYDAIDASGQAAVQKTRIVIVRDTTPPDPDVKPLPSVSGECSVEISDIPTATDICSGSINGIPSDPLVPAGQGIYICTEQGTHTVTWTYTDNNGNVATQKQTITVDDKTPPVPDAAELETVEGECSAEITTAPTATDNCAGIITGTTTDPLEYTKSGTYTVTWVYDDGNGNTATQTQTVKVEDITPPTINLSESKCVELDKSVNVNMLTVSASDNCSSEVELVIDKVEIFNKRGHRVSGKDLYNIVKHKKKKKHHVKGKIIYTVVENDIYAFPKGKDWSIVVTVTASDSNGNTTTESLSRPLFQCNRWSKKMARLIRLLYILIWKWHHCW
jgi:sugar lactone lactonase YvrE